MYLLFKTGDITILTDKLVFDTDEIQEVETASELVQELRNIMEKRELELANSLKKGYELGYKKGADDAYRKYMETFQDSMYSLTKKITEYRNERLTTATKIAINIFEVILGELEPENVMDRIVRKAIKQYKKNTRITVKVPIEVVEYIEKSCEKIDKTEEYEDCNIDVEGDKNLNLYECILVSEYGEAVASLGDQLVNIESEIEKSIAQGELTH